MLSFYRNEQIPDYGFVNKLKLIDNNLYVVFDSISMRWHIYYKDIQGENHLVYVVCNRDHNGVDIGYRPIDDRAINSLLKMDLSRKNVSATQYKNKLVADENVYEEKLKKQLYNYEEDMVMSEQKTFKKLHELARSIPNFGKRK